MSATRWTRGRSRSMRPPSRKRSTLKEPTDQTKARRCWRSTSSRMKRYACVIPSQAKNARRISCHRKNSRSSSPRTCDPSNSLRPPRPPRCDSHLKEIYMPRYHLCPLSIAFLVAASSVWAQPGDLTRSAKSGAWSASATWEGGKVPAAGAKVQIRSGDVVTYDVKSDAVIRFIHVAGTLRFAADKDTVLNVGLIKIQNGEDATEDGFDCDTHMRAVSKKGPRADLPL